MGSWGWRGRIAALGLVLAAGWAEGWTLDRSARPDVGCRPWFGLVQAGVLTWQCHEAAAVAASRGCQGRSAPEPGAILTVVHTSGGCRVRQRRASARQRLALGLSLDVNAETEQGLQAVPGIGPATARAIVAGRPYATLTALERVRGIGPARRRALARTLTITAPRPPSPSSPPPGASAPRTP